MQAQTIENDLSTPANDNGGGRARSSDSFVESALDAFDALNAPKDKPAGKEPRREREAPEADPESDADEQGAVAEPEDEEQGDEEQGAEAQDAEEEEHDTRGSKDEPFNVKDLPDDKYIKLKVDGEEVTVALSDLPSGWIRQETFNRWANKTKLLANEAEAMVTKARETDARMRKELSTFLHDPQELLDFYMKSDQREQVLFEAARRYAEIRRQFRERPEERLAFQRRRDQERLAFEREQFESQKRAEQETRAQQERLELMRKTFVPGWEAGLRKAGFPEVTQALRDEVLIRCQQKQARGEDVTTADVAEFVVRAAKVLELPPQRGKKRPAPAPVAAKDDAPRKKANGKDPWAGKSARERIRDPDYFLRNLKSRDFR